MTKIAEEMARILEAVRDRKLPMWLFRHHSNVLADYLIEKLLSKIPSNRWDDIVPILVFRASLVFLHSLALKLPRSPIGLIGLKRDERTAVAEKYYTSLPKLSEKSILAIFDPMLATAGTLTKTMEEIDLRSVADIGRRFFRGNVFYVGFLATRPGYEKALKLHIPANNIILLAIDPELDANFYIVPGLGDFGDRYFGN